ncbi:TRAP transporter large permease [Cohaesibacter gelatinilyticus]|uniref:TRAP transporter large permease protein n=1 Tax=Cohaesibacter gelatinilyticus TaxID=372072 RepID=A0A285NGW2_9HYPH|nr:TRAP transporter large permease [Cohaesibacter gelatinilyticus]SNZ06881.1 TRAP transporter, DctM subunit [Cohaesibacter gelatinilyticus]
MSDVIFGLSDLELGIASFPVLLLLIFLRLPIGLAMLVLGLGGSWLINGSPLMALAQLKHTPHGQFSSYSLSILPLFLLMGQFATLGGMSGALMNAANTFVGHHRGGLAMAVVGASGGFGAICGSSLATAATMSQVALPDLRKAGYPGGLASATLAAGGTLGILIPPSIVLVVYAILAEQNIAKLFVAALVPGLLAMLGYILTIAIIARFQVSASRDAIAIQSKQNWAQRLIALSTVWPVLLIFLIVVGGIYGGFFTPTEAAAIGAAGTGLLAWKSGRLNWGSLKMSIASTASASAMVFFIILGAGFFNAFLALCGLPQALADYVVNSGFSAYGILLLLLGIFLILGCVMESLSIILLMVPLVFPIVSALDFGLSPSEFGLWFGILVLIVVEVGLITPPVGLNLFVIHRLAPDIALGSMFRAILPFVMSDIVRVALLVALPVLSLGLVRLVF